ncbi:hypothetical protein [Actinomycetospora cinnamomea]|uniref:Uncharacterized protein n=1 Tax=Actinomycetospora cinnamomea TaxID=663609 RepID=A0A2U1F6F6_9PSEU|nr:hypothetical protein [Actinomycetospora cinnamomea]PVZ07777.1 hypothetical protein C8D89_111148 [Actinomycetospora cinnamomea]
MISEGLGDTQPAMAGAPWRRGLDLFDDYAGGGVLSEELADDLVNELVAGPRPRRARRAVSGGPSGPDGPGGPGPQPSRPPAGPPAARPRLTLVRGGASGT